MVQVQDILELLPHGKINLQDNRTDMLIPVFFDTLTEKQKELYVSRITIIDEAMILYPYIPVKELD